MSPFSTPTLFGGGEVKFSNLDLDIGSPHWGLFGFLFSSYRQLLVSSMLYFNMPRLLFVLRN
jgi:hypothetical protein